MQNDEEAQQCGYQDVKRLTEQVFRSTDVMIADRSANFLNEECFMQDFIAAWGYPEQEMRNFFDDFYSRAFPRLKSYCSPFPGVPDMMSRVLARGYKVVIATNAVFPLTAIQQRLDWAGIGHLPFDLITSYEFMHFCKPHLEYYQEISDIIGVKPADCLMVGNDVGEDLPAGQIGMKTFLVEDLLIDKEESASQADWRGE